MSSNDKYCIREDLINEIECNHHRKKNLYIGFCQTCQKNYCSWCKEHKFHKVVKFDDIEPSQEKYEEFEQELITMQSVGEKIKKYFSEIKNFQKTIMEINELINNSLKQLNQFNKDFNSHL